MKHLGVLLILVASCSAQQKGLSSSGNLSGTLVGDDGTPVVRAHLSFHLLASYPQGKPQQTEWTAVSGRGGTFQVDRLRHGNYRICAQAPQTAWLNPCVWGGQPQTVS